MITAPTPKRGRPVTGDAKPPAKRKQYQRERDAELIATVPLAELPERCLIAILSTSKYEGLQQYAWSELGKRKGFV